jgi:hypothetical protein
MCECPFIKESVQRPIPSCNMCYHQYGDPFKCERCGPLHSLYQGKNVAERQSKAIGEILKLCGTDSWEVVLKKLVELQNSANTLYHLTKELRIMRDRYL